MRELFTYEVKRTSLKFSESISEKYYSKKGNKVVEAEHGREQYVELLMSYDHSARAQALARSLDNCDKGSRCRSIVCPVCTYAAEKYFKRLCEAGASALFASVCIPQIIKESTDRRRRRYRASCNRSYAKFWGNS